MADGRPTWQLILEAAERVTAAGNAPFKLEDLITEVQRMDPSRERGSIQPIVQGMTVNVGKGSRSSAGRTVFRRTDHGCYELQRPLSRGPKPSTDAEDSHASHHLGMPQEHTPTVGPVPPVTKQEKPPAAAGDSAEQRAAETLILAAAARKLGVSLTPRRLYLGDGVRVEVDGVSDDPPVFCEVWAHQGPAKVAQGHKVLHDALKLYIAGEALTPRPRLVLALTDAAAASRFQNHSWYALALRRLGVDLITVDIPDSVRESIRAAQCRQGRPFR
jgi:hypothetical protein